ncbi:MAG: dihydropteroate synthase [Spirochaetia bacterium]|nr:dihydropteroate synthase [Spirochaetia bacterium]
MGIINCTPDSFFAESRKYGFNEAIETVRMMILQGADIIDIGGESTRPGSDYVSENEEIKRIIPVIRGIVSEFSIPVSVDTRKSRVAYEAIEAGASIINDISGLKDDPVLAGVVRDAKCDIILMHKRGDPSNMQENPYYVNAAAEIMEELKVSIDFALESGIEKDNIVIDPGIGFGKRTEDNIEIIKNIAFFKKTGFPVLVGHSRKSFIGAITGKKQDERLAGTLAAGLIALVNGADILRVHDVEQTSDTIKVLMTAGAWGSSVCGES